MADDGTADAEPHEETPDDEVRVWLVERTYSDDVSTSVASRGS